LVNCTVRPELLDALHDNELRGLRARFLRAHVNVCAQCQGYLAEADRVHSLLAMTPRLEPPPDFPGRVVQAVVGPPEEAVLGALAPSLQAPEHLGGAEFTARVMSRVSGARDRRERSRGLMLTAASVCAIVVVYLVAVTWWQRETDGRTALGLQAISLQVSRVGALLDPANWAATRVARDLQALRARAARQAGCELEELVGEAPGDGAQSPPQGGSADPPSAVNRARR